MVSMKKVNNGQIVDTMTTLMISNFSLGLFASPFIRVDFHFFPFIVQEALKTLAVSPLPHNAPGSPSPAAPPPLSRPQVPLTPIPGTPDTLASVQLLTARYRRRPLTVDEMEYIQVRRPSSSLITRGKYPTKMITFMFKSLSCYQLEHNLCPWFEKNLHNNLLA